MSKIIYIAGLGHSGSTILDMSLGTLPGVTGLGELKTLLDDRTRDSHYTSLCSCGKIATDCPVWKKVPSALTGLQKDEEKIEAILALLKGEANEEIVLVDSSKNSYSYLKYLSKNHDLKVIFLTRDIRSWSYVRHLSTGKPILYYLVRWILENMKLYHRITSMGIEVIRVGYEELALYPEYILKIITDRTGLSYSESVLKPERTSSHIISGNVARTDHQKKAGWQYDARWLLSRRIMIFSPFILFLNWWNRGFVYSNIKGASIADFYLFGSKRKKELGRINN